MCLERRRRTEPGMRETGTSPDTESFSQLLEIQSEHPLRRPLVIRSIPVHRRGMHYGVHVAMIE